MFLKYRMTSLKAEVLMKDSITFAGFKEECTKMLGSPF